MTSSMHRVFKQPRRKINMPFKNKYGHQVLPDASGHYFNVTSGRSKEHYIVTPTGGQQATCTCQGYSHTQLPCSHVAAVIEYAAILLAGQEP